MVKQVNTRNVSSQPSRASKYERVSTGAQQDQKPPKSSIKQQQTNKPDKNQSAPTKTKKQAKKEKKGRQKLEPVPNEDDDEDDEFPTVLVVLPTKGVVDLLRMDVEEVTDIVRSNFDSVLERDAKIEELEMVAERLHDLSLEFRKTGRLVMCRHWWRNNRWFCILAFLIILAVAVGLGIGLTKWLNRSAASSQSSDSGIPPSPVAMTSSTPLNATSAYSNYTTVNDNEL